MLRRQREIAERNMEEKELREKKGEMVRRIRFEMGERSMRGSG